MQDVLRLTRRDICVQLHVMFRAIYRVDVDLHVGERQRRPLQVIRDDGREESNFQFHFFLHIQSKDAFRRRVLEGFLAHGRADV
jgi:hypothetical protein